MHCRKLPRSIRGEVTSYYANIWVASAGAVGPAKFGLMGSFNFALCWRQGVCCTSMHACLLCIFGSAHICCSNAVRFAPVTKVPIITETMSAFVQNLEI